MTASNSAPQRPSRIVCVLLPRFNMMSLISVLEPARVANYLVSEPLYEMVYCSPDGTQVTASNGMPIACGPLPEKLSQDDLVLVVASWGAEHYANPALLNWLRRQERLGMRLCAVEMAPYVFARAGLLAGRAATTHWAYLPGFQEKYPDILGAEQLFTIDGRIMTCAGSTGALDFMLHIVRERQGEALAQEISNIVLLAQIREAGAPQRQSIGRGQDGMPGPVNAAVALMTTHIAEPLPVPEIARTIGLSQRQLERQFKQAMGCSVVQFGLILRLQHARVLLISTELSVREIATASGFNSLSHFAYAFRNCFGRRPSDYRQAWPDHADAPTWPGTLSTYLDSRARASVPTGTPRD